MRGMYVHCLTLVLAAGAVGCASTGSAAGRYATLSQAPQRDSLRAQQLNDEGLAQVEEDDLAAAEESFRKALEADLFYPSAHNNLALVLLRTGRLYESAWEFQYAAKLMPKSAEPRHNLGALMERSGRLDEAERLYTEALELSPGGVEVMGHLARVYVKTDRKDQRLRDLLEKIVYQSDAGDWDKWARMWLLRLGE